MWSRKYSHWTQRRSLKIPMGKSLLKANVLKKCMKRNWRSPWYPKGCGAQIKNTSAGGMDIFCNNTIPIRELKHRHHQSLSCHGTHTALSWNTDFVKQKNKHPPPQKNGGGVSFGTRTLSSQPVKDQNKPTK